MPPVAAAVAGYAVATAAGFAAGTLGFAIVSGITSFVVNGALSSMTKKSPSAVQQAASAVATFADGSQTLTTLEPAAPWQIVYGETVKGGKLAFRHVTGTSSTVSSTSPRVESHVIPHSAPFTVTIADPASYHSTVSVSHFEWVGSAEVYTEIPFSLTGGSPAQGEYSVSGGAYTFNAADAGKSINVTFNYRVTETVAHNRLHLVIVLAAHECEEIGDVYFDDEIVPLDADGNATGKYANHVLVKKHLGASDQAADTTLMSEAPDKWTQDHRLRGHAYIYVRLLRNRDLFPSGVPNIKAKVKGRKVYAARTDVIGYSPNSADCIGDYLNHPVWGLNAVYGTEIDTATLNAAANIADEVVATADGGSEHRYTCNGIVDLSRDPQDILERMLTSCAGRLVYVGGVWKFYAGAYIAPTVTLNEGDARGPIRMRTLRPAADLFNGVKGLYVSPGNLYQPASFPGVQSSVYLDEDNGEMKWEEIDLEFTNSPSMAQRIAKIALERARRQVTGSYPAKLTAYRIEPPETFTIDNAKFGYADKVFEVMNETLVVEQDADGMPRFGVNLDLQETDSGVYTWSSSEEQESDAAPTTTLPDPRDVAPPGIPVVSEEIYETTGSSGVKAKVVLTWAPSPHGQAWRYEHEYKARGAVSWIPSSGLINGTRDELIDLAPGRYQSRVRTVSVLGVRSAWAQVEYDVVGLSAPPANVTGFTVQSYAEAAKFTWDKATDLDVLIGGRVIVRWTPVTVGYTWNQGTPINTDGFPGDSTGGTGPLQTGAYMAKFEDSTGHVSATEADFVITEALLRTLTSLDFADIHPTFAGTGTNVVVVDSHLQLVAGDMWDSIVGNIDDWGVVDYLGGIESTGTITFSEKLDLGSVKSCRLLATLKSEGFSTGDVWDARTGLIDTWGTIDGDTIEDADVVLYVRTTDDDPAGGSPAWRDWHPLGFVGDYRTRGFEFRADFTSGDPTHNRRITELTFTAKE